MKKSYKVVIVDWLDAKQGGDWAEQSDIDKMAPEPSKSVGFLVRDDDIAVVVAQTKNTGHLGDCLIIPRGMVRRVTVVK